ncbi:MAG: PAS domain S-box protein [Clostridiaceae bacterium]|nr:PAS domain S-box protein [Clostridiaceae bacterium]
MKKIFIFLLCCILFFTLSLKSVMANQDNSNNKRNILILNSYHQGLEWTDDIVISITEHFTNRSDVELYIEYMDTKRWMNDVYFKNLHDIYYFKYRNINFDTIIVSDDDALVFALENRDALFPNVPIVFCGINYYHDYQLQYPLVTGVIEDFDIRATMELMIEIHPNLREVVIINDKSSTGENNKKVIEGIIPDFEGEVSFRWFEDMTMNELEQAVSKLKGETAILLMTYNTDAAENYFSYDELVNLVRKSSSVPIYGVWNMLLGKGIVGGKLTSGSTQGKTAALLAERVLNGENPDEIPVVTDGQNHYMFDYREIKRFALSLKDLPEESIIINQPYSLYYENKELFKSVFFIILMLIIIIGILIYLNLRRRVAEQELRKEQEKVKTLNAELENMVEERTGELKCSNDQLYKQIILRDKVEKKLIEKLTFIESLMDTIPNPIFLKDLDCKFIKCNSSFESLIGVTSQELKGKKINDLCNEELVNIYNEKDKELLQNIDNTDKQKYETLVLFADGSLRNVIINKAIFKDEMGDPLGIVGVITDITNEKEKELLKQTVVEKKLIIDKILENDKMKTEFFSNISHELRTPLNIVLGTVQLMENYATEDTHNIKHERLTKNIAIIKQNCYRLLRLVNNLIDVTKIDAKALEIQLKNCNIVSIVEEITLSISEYIESKGVILIFDTEIEEKIMACDSDKIERIMLNLLSNAVKFTQNKGNILVSISDEGDSVSIKVSDNGIGIPLHKQKEIFSRFCQIIDLFTRNHEGSGIGLNLVKTLVEMHGGTISVESQLGQGSTFIINLPVKTVTDEIEEYNAILSQDCVERINIEFSDIYSVS